MQGNYNDFLKANPQIPKKIIEQKTTEVNPNFLFLCDKCGFRFNTKRGLSLHKNDSSKAMLFNPFI